MPAISAVVVACEMLERRDVRALTVPLFGRDLATMLALSQETADQCGADMEISGAGQAVSIRLTRVRDKRGRR